jgi:hypothetical protein
MAEIGRQGQRLAEIGRDWQRLAEIGRDWQAMAGPRAVVKMFFGVAPLDPTETKAARRYCRAAASIDPIRLVRMVS